MTNGMSVEDWLTYRANDHALMTSYERSMYRKTLSELARLRSELTKAQQVSVRQANELRKQRA